MLTFGKEVVQMMTILHIASWVIKLSANMGFGQIKSHEKKKYKTHLKSCLNQNVFVNF